MSDQPAAAPDSTAVRVALWRALHLELDPPPALARDAGFAAVRHVSGASLAQRYFADHPLRMSAEEMLVAAT